VDCCFILLPLIRIWQQVFALRKGFIGGTAGSLRKRPFVQAGCSVADLGSETLMDQLGPSDEPLIAAKSRANRLSFAVLLLFFRAHGRFPRAQDEIDPEAIAGLALQLGIELAPTRMMRPLTALSSATVPKSAPTSASVRRRLPMARI
jgi:Domain of unknown function (DUF4158)